MSTLSKFIGPNYLIGKIFQKIPNCKSPQVQFFYQVKIVCVLSEVCRSLVQSHVDTIRSLQVRRSDLCGYCPKFVGLQVIFMLILSKVCQSIGQSRVYTVQKISVRMSESVGLNKPKKYTCIDSRYGIRIGLRHSGTYVSSLPVFIRYKLTFSNINLVRYNNCSDSEVLTDVSVKGYSFCRSTIHL